MQDYNKKRGRRPRGEGEKMDKIGSVRYKCPYKACGLEYQSSLGYKRHLMYYKHSIFTPSERKLVCGYVDCSETENLKEHIYKCHPEDADELAEAYDAMVKTYEDTEDGPGGQSDHDIVHDEGLLDISRALEDDGIIKDILMCVFPKGITYIIDFDTFTEYNQAFFCRIPGCGRQFKSLMAYKYHCGKFTHTFKAIVDEYMLTHKDVSYSDVKEQFKKKFNLENRFLLEGVSHHLMRMPDQYYNFIFTFDEVQIGHEKRRAKRKTGDHISEFSLGEEGRHDESTEEDPRRFKEEEEERKETFKVESIVLNGRKLPMGTYYRQGRLSFLNIKQPVVCLANLDAFVIVGAKGESGDASETLQDSMKAHNIFCFTGGGAVFFVVDSLRVVSRITVEKFGFPRKIVCVAPRKVLCLFNDGFLREISFTPEYALGEIRKVEAKGPSIDFVVFKNMVITCSHRALYNITTRKEKPFESPITSMSTTNEVVLVVDANGKIFSLSSSLDILGTVPSKVGTNTVCGLGLSHDLVFISNSLYGLGRIYSIQRNSTLLVSPHASSNVILIKPGFILSSGLDGTLCVSGYDIDPKIYMKVLKTEIKGDELYITTSEEEHVLTEHAPPPTVQDYRVCVQGIVPQGTTLVAALTCGILVSITDFFRTLPQTILPSP
ncbi:hypothetical protein NECID01_1613 [Nematocida sp. AWRm77]|nr:hypothetical protein NECID01_1613 [Nematocida sp. AWRm77]